MPGRECNRGIERAVRLDRLSTVAGFARLHGADGIVLFPEGTVRRWINSDYCRFRSRCVVKVGGKSMIDLDAVDEWLEEQRGGRTEHRQQHDEGSRATPPRRQRRDYRDVLKEAGLA